MGAPRIESMELLYNRSISTRMLSKGCRLECQRQKKRSISGDSHSIPIYNAGKRMGPKPLDRIDSPFTTIVRATPIKNTAWVLAPVHCQRVSSWTGFNIKLRSGIDILEDNIAYLPTVNAPATDLGTVYEVLLRSLKIMQALV